MSEIETELALQVSRPGVHVPSNVSLSGDVSFAWDNNDILEETLSGEGTTRCTTGIVLQRVIPHDQPPALVEVTTRQLTNTRPLRSLKIGPLPELHYISGARPQPPEVDGDSQPDSESPASYITGKHHDLLWTLPVMQYANTVYARVRVRTCVRAYARSCLCTRTHAESRGGCAQALESF